jgi:PAS domain S-box-containing protein
MHGALLPACDINFVHMTGTSATRHSSSWFGTIDRTQRNLALVLACILLPTFVGLAILFVQLFDAATRGREEYAVSTRRDTLLLSTYRTALELSNLLLSAREMLAADEASTLYLETVADRLRMERGEYERLLPLSPSNVRDTLAARFARYSSDIDLLLASEKEIKGPTRLSTQTSRNNLSVTSFVPRTTEMLHELRGSFQYLLEAELEENVVRVSESEERVSNIAFRTFGFSIILFIVGSGLAFFLLRKEGKSAEASLRFYTILQNSINPIEVINAQGRVVYVNPAFERWARVRIKDVLGSHAFESVRRLNSPQQNGSFWEAVVNELRQGKVWSSDVEVVRDRGEVTFAFLIVSPVLDQSGDFVECIAIYHDITERKELARKFEESQEKYQNIVESSLDGIVIVQDGRLVFANSSAMKIFGYTSTEEMRSVSFTDTVAPASRFFVLEGYQKGKLIGEDILRNYELKGLTKQGKIIDLEVNAKLVSWNGRPAVQASFRDITERKALERDQALWLWEHETMSTIDRQLVSTVDLQKVLETISHHAKILTRADWAGVMLIDPTTNSAQWRAAKGNELPLPSEPFRLGETHATIAQSREALVIQDFGNNPRFPVEEFPPFKEEHIISAARFPLVVEKEIRGQLMVGYRQHHEFSPRELRLLSSLAEKSSIALANAQLYDDLLSREKELEHLSGARVRAQEEERRRIAREIHDSLGQMLTAIKFNIEILEDSSNLQRPEDQQRLADIKGLLDSAMEEAREISYNLMPSVLVDFGLVPALQLLCDQFAKRNSLKLSFHSSGIDDRLDRAVEIGLFRIAQEALNNIAKHAHAAEVNVQLIGDGEHLRLLIDDDGRGFKISAFDQMRGDRHGMGLVSMRERATSFQGSFVIDSKPGRGTEIIVEIPLKHSNGN